MKWLISYKIKYIVAVFWAVMVLGSRTLKADFTFGEPTNPGSPINTSSNEATFCLSADDLEMYISSNRPGTYGIGDIWVSTRATINDSWIEPVNLGSVVNSSFPDTVEYISPDGLELYFDSYNRTGGRGGWDIWVTLRATKDDPWTEPTNLGTMFNTSADDWKACISSDNLNFYFTSMRPGGYGGADIWVAKRTTTEEPWKEPINLGPIVNSTADDSGQIISGDNLTLFFHSMRSGGYGGHDLYITKRKTINDDWSIPINLGPKLNTASDEIMPYISANRSTLYFCSSRSGGQGQWDIYQASIEPIVDFNSDGIVDINELVIMIENWGTDESLCDIGPMPWGDGIVDRSDLEVLMKYWNQVVDVAAYYKLDETEGNIAYDCSGYYCDANLIGDPNWQPDGGIIDGALEFDGINDYISTPFILNPKETSEFSVFAWIKGGAPGQVILSQIGSTNLLSADASDGCLMTDKGSGRGASTLLSQTVITDGDWHRIGFTWDGSNRILYVDDVIAAIDTQPALPGSDEGFYIGAGKDLEIGAFFSGMIDDVRIYNRVIIP